MIELLKSHTLHVLALLLIGFIIGRMTAPDPIGRERQRQAREVARIRNQTALSPETLAEVRRLKREGKPIDAIRLVRTSIDIDLKAAKDLVDGLSV